MKIFRKGFTLIELLIVIVIIGILSVGFAPTLLNAPKKARDAVRKSDLANIKKAIEAFAVENGGYPVPDTYCLSLAKSFKLNGVDKTSEFLSYFQGGVIPSERQSSNSMGANNCMAPSYGYLLSPGGKACYSLIAKMETNNSGNTNVLPLNFECSTLLTENSGKFYHSRTSY